ncbi:MAG: class I SAM-dependent methyltransferase [Flavobacteriales bacterium]|nr:class I SAM-dependent methyltransferase [Flavobacteriales bacterium]
MDNDYVKINKASWNNRTEAHVKSEFYDVKGFLDGKSSLNSIELEPLGDVRGKSILHLQCHFGQDTISLARMGASARGVDLSDKAIEKAKELTEMAGVECSFTCCDIYDLSDHLNEQFDIVYTSYGTIGWLPDLDKWADIVSRFLKPEGKFVFVEFHPVVWMFDNDFKEIGYNYFNSGSIIESETGTYADREADITQDYIMWNHGLGEVLNSLIGKGMLIKSLDEFDYSPHDCFDHTIEFEPKKFRIEHLGNKIPMVYALTASKSIE